MTARRRCSHTLIVEARPIRPDGVASSLQVSRKDGGLSSFDDDAPGEPTTGAQNLGLDGLVPAEGGRSSWTGGEDGALPGQGLLEPVSVLGSGVNASREPGLTVVKEGSGQHDAAVLD